MAVTMYKAGALVDLEADLDIKDRVVQELQVKVTQEDQVIITPDIMVQVAAGPAVLVVTLRVGHRVALDQVQP
jgi:hypothetical protein